ncbi:MAG: hypothetical protein CM1200mP14_23860 [Gammaproteobacteria bacterium]|nr:MAG: hypothetical protein CM1200mP14_23860 [Gammaproteobacteria bacterium]
MSLLNLQRLIYPALQPVSAYETHHTHRNQRQPADMKHEVIVDPTIAEQASASVERMLEVRA